MALVLDGNGTMTVGNGDITGLATGALPSNVIGAGAVLQVVQATHSTEVSWTTQDTEQFIYQATITPTLSTSKILAIAAVGGIDNGGSGRISGRIRWNTTSSGNTGTQICGLTQVALPGSGTAHKSAMAMTGLSDAVGTTSTLYFKVILTKGDSGGTMYACQYGSQSQLTLLEIAA